MDFREYKYLVACDLYRCERDTRFSTFIKYVLFNAGFKYSFWRRTGAWATGNPFLRYTLLPFVKFMLWRFLYRYGIHISHNTQIGSGLYIGHFGGIFVNYETVIGKNCNISQGVTVGPANRGSKRGCPVIGDNVYIGPGAKVFGKVRVGNNVAIGANCVVTRDVPDNAVVVGVPCKVISLNGSAGYVNNTDYPALPAHGDDGLLTHPRLDRS